MAYFIGVAGLLLALLASGCSDAENLDFRLFEAKAETLGWSHKDIERYKDEFDAREYAEFYGVEEFAQMLPLRVGMTISEVRSALKNLHETEYVIGKTLNAAAVREGISEGSGWIHFRTYGRAYFFVCVVILNDRLASVWVVPGNADDSADVYYRMLGSGALQAPVETF